MNYSNLSIQKSSITSLKLRADNPRLHSSKQISQIAESIRQFGFNVPVLVDGELRVIAGHGRVLACELLGITEVPIITLDHLSKNQLSAFLIADNRLTENAEWNARLLGEQLKILAASDIDFSLEATGFEMGQIDILVENLDVNPVEADEADPTQPSGIPVTRTSDLWRLGNNRVLCASALHRNSYDNLMENEKAKFVFADPPYNLHIAGHVSGNGRHCHREFPMASGEMAASAFSEFLANALTLLASFSTTGSLHYICIDWRHVEQLLAAGRSAYSELKNICVWVKDNAGLGSFYRSQHELIAVFQHGKAQSLNNIQLGRFGRSRTNVWKYPGVNSFARETDEGDLLSLHPTVKPLALVADAIKDCTARRDLVLDPFLGSGTTIIAAERTGRICYGLELDPLYVDTIIRRWQRFTNLKAIHHATGNTFEEREKEFAYGQ